MDATILIHMTPSWAKAVATAGLFLAFGAASGAAPDVHEQCSIAESDMAAAIAGEEPSTYDSSYRASCPDGQAPAFPGAQGFGACVTGGRGGRVIEVTSLLATRDPGTLQWALDQTGPRIIVFRVSGVIDRAMEITQGDVTIAGQTSPGGITVRGILCDNQVYEKQSTCSNVIIRHIRSRPVMSETRPGQGYLLDDAARIDGGQRVIVDHLSLSGAEDETFQISRATDITVQNSTFSELMSAHEWSGMLINYSSVAHPLQNISLHHNAWNRQQGRMPEINCEANTDDGSTSNCSHRLNLEVSSNLTWDQASEITYGGADGLRVDLNWVGNMGFNRPTYTQPLIAEDLFSYPDNRIYVNDNRYFQFPQLSNYALAGCCNDWASDPDYFAQRAVPPTVLAARIGHPQISYTPAASVMSYAVKYLGAFPRDPQDRRLLYPIAQRRIATAGGWNTRSNNPCADSFTTDAAPAAPLDTDHDGMPDEWELANGLNPAVNDATGSTLALLNPLYAGLTNVEAYLHERHLQLLGLLPSVQRLLIDHYYSNILKRAPDAGGKAFWQNEVTRMSGLGVSPTETHIAMAGSFYISPEFLARGLTDDQFIQNLYLTFLNRSADQSGLDYWRCLFAAGVPRDMVMYGFVFSAEFKSFMVQNLGSTSQRPEVGAVMDYYRGILGRLPEDGGIKYWVNQFRTAQCSGNPTADVYAAATSIAAQFFGSPEYTGGSPAPRDYVADLYNAFMRRIAEPGGYNYWINQITSGAQTRDQARQAFIDSPEFAARVQAITAASCIGLMQ